MEARLIHFAVSLPWWNSLDSVRKVHSYLEATSIACFVLLVGFDSAAHVLDKKRPERARMVAGIGLVFFWLAVAAEIVGYKYGQRNDELSGQQITSLDSKASDAAGKAAKAVTDSSDAETKSGGAVEKAGLAEKSATNAVNAVGKIKGEVNSAKTTADLAKAEVDGAKRDAEAVSKEVKTARAELDVVESFVSARHIVDTKPFEKLKRFKERKLKLVIFSFAGDEEARQFCSAVAAQVVPVLSWKEGANEWPIAGCGSEMGGNGAGVFVTGSDTEFVTALADAIREASGAVVQTLPAAPGQTATAIHFGARIPGYFQPRTQ